VEKGPFIWQDAENLQCAALNKALQVEFLHSGWIACTFGCENSLQCMSVFVEKGPFIWKDAENLQCAALSK